MIRWLSAVALVGFCVSFAAYAEEESGLELSGYVDTSVTLNLNNPKSADEKTPAQNVYFPYATAPFSFHLGNAHLVASGSSGKASYAVELDAGTIAKVDSGGNLLDLQEAYITYDFDTLKVTAGKFVTFEGIEVVEAPNNPTITHGLLFWLAEPVGHVGAYVTYPVEDLLEFRLGAVNGWDLLHDTDNAKTIIGRVGFNLDPLTVGVSGTFGKEGGNTEPRLSLDVTGVLAVGEQLALNLQGNMGSEDSVDPGTGDSTSQSWMGLGLQPVYSLSDKVTLSARGELFKDDGSRTGVDQTLISVTGCVGYALGETTKARGEFRFDSSDADVYVDSDGLPTGAQMTVSVQLTQSF